MHGHKITHIRKKGPVKNCKCITNVKVDKTNRTVEDIINMMMGKARDGRVHQFYIEIGGSRIGVRAAPENEPSYIRTERDDSPYDNLLSLPQF
jgi:hypothetical protein